AKPLMLSDNARRWRRLVQVTCLVVVAYLIGLAALLNSLEKPGGLGSAGDLKIHLLQVVGLLTGVGALIAIANAVKSWADADELSWYKLWNLGLAVACIGFFWFLYHWHLLNLNLNY